MRPRSALLLGILVAAAAACDEGSGPRIRDGGRFSFPDGGFRDAAVPDSGVDAGPFQCAPACTGDDVCGCLADDCGCHPPQTLSQACDPQVPETCAAPLECTRARVRGADVHLCSDGSEGVSCSKTNDICTTALGCVCLTPPSGQTDCRCTETAEDNGLCDIMVDETCASGTCVRATTPGGVVYFICSDGSEGLPCQPGDGSCTTSLGCACPVVGGRERCACMEPSSEGQPCDPTIQGSCVAPLTCESRFTPSMGRNTTCQSGGLPDAGVPLPCDPNNPGSCPNGQMCVEVAPGMFACR